MMTATYKDYASNVIPRKPLEKMVDGVGGLKSLEPPPRDRLGRHINMTAKWGVGGINERKTS